MSVSWGQLLMTLSWDVSMPVFKQPFDLSTPISYHNSRLSRCTSLTLSTRSLSQQFLKNSLSASEFYLKGSRSHVLPIRSENAPLPDSPSKETMIDDQSSSHSLETIDDASRTLYQNFSLPLASLQSTECVSLEMISSEPRLVTEEAVNDPLQFHEVSRQHKGTFLEIFINSVNEKDIKNVHGIIAPA